MTSCIAIEFASALDDVTLRMAFAAKACDTACTAGTACGGAAYDRATLFLAPGPGPSSTWTLAGHAPLTSTLQDFTMLVPDSGVAKVVVVCRGGGGAQRDDVVVDGVTGHCR